MLAMPALAFSLKKPFCLRFEKTDTLRSTLKPIQIHSCSLKYTFLKVNELEALQCFCIHNFILNEVKKRYLKKYSIEILFLYF